MSLRFSDRLEKFLSYWDGKVRRGENSEIGVLERMMLEIYDNWLRENDCGKVGCKRDCYDKPDIKDHCMRGMFCMHCGRAFCIKLAKVASE